MREPKRSIAIGKVMIMLLDNTESGLLQDLANVVLDSLRDLSDEISRGIHIFLINNINYNNEGI
jgi:hypothetical protein